MAECLERAAGLDELREIVLKVLSDREELEIGAFPLSEQFWWRGDRLCGIQFRLHGPRAVVMSAIWDAQTKRVLFYGADGERFLEQDWPVELAELAV